MTNPYDDIEYCSSIHHNNIFATQFHPEKSSTKGIDIYKEMLDAGIAKECARFVLPLATPTRMYMNGTIRSWIHYINLRSGHGTQKEHMDVANQCKEIFIQQLPVVSEALGWNDPS